MKKSTLNEYLAIFFRYSKYSAILLVLLMLAASLLEGLGLALFLPLIQLMAGTMSGATAITADPSAKFLMGFSLSMPVTLALIVAVFGIKNIILYVQKFYAADLSLKFEKRLKEDVMGAVFSSKWRALISFESGTLMNAISTQAKFAAESFKILSLLSLEALNIAVYCAMGLWISMQSFFLSAATGAVSYFILRRFIGQSRVIGGDAVKIKNQVSGQWMTDLASLKFIKGNHFEEHRKKTAFSLMDRLYKTELRGEKYAAIMDTLPDFLMAVVMAVILYVSFYVVHVPGDKLVVTVLILYRMNRRLMNLQNLKQRLFLYLPSFEMCQKIEIACEQSREIRGQKIFDGLKRNIVFDKIDFHYDGRASVLASFSIEIQKNQFVALIGKSGSGKTTALDLLLGLLEPAQGRVLVDGTPLQEYDLFSWRKKISYVPQEPVIVEGSLFDNIRMDNLEADLAAVREAARLAHADEFISSRPEAYKAIPGDRGVQLSGGQKQRIALARALLRKPDILVLDEATSSLDQESEAMIQKALEELSGKLTIVVVAHRLSTIEKADKIYVLENGSAVDSGKMKDLREKSPAFQKLYGHAVL